MRLIPRLAPLALVAVACASQAPDSGMLSSPTAPAGSQDDGGTSRSSSTPPGGADASTADASASDAGGPSADAASNAHSNQCQAPLEGRVSLPADDSQHTSEPMEWWYWTGHLKTSDGRWFGFEEVFFRTVVLGVPNHMVHSALTDIAGNTFHHFAIASPGDLTAIPNGFSLDMGGQTALGADGHDTLHAQGDGYAFDLKLAPDGKRPVLQHRVGYTDYSFGGYTYYYSRPRLSVTGTLKVGNENLEVTGTGWFDHQYGDIKDAVSNGWDWFAFQLDDRREIMIFVVRAQGKQILVGASLTDADCVTSEIDPSDVDVSSTGTWQSTHTPCTYPAGWNVRVRDETFVVTPLIPDQELYTSVPVYWEGASGVTKGGAPVGRAYVELNGYCPPH